MRFPHRRFRGSPLPALGALALCLAAAAGDVVVIVTSDTPAPTIEHTGQEAVPEDVGPTGGVLPPVVTGEKTGVLPDLGGTSDPAAQVGRRRPDCSADVNGDGFIDGEDLKLVALALGVCPLTDCPEDINDDGAVDVIDLLAVLADWGACG